ncbi:hypothetical protein HPB52_024505 [Rhipicephalus sanguineus]|uniref:Uncharacterized protein n=1 Tax=Rhipicephalus sanguineus TaxID=34632 RepID=A0A9D4P9D7_RHISA|nr:hypothetical protein HPB52_024505 [Rhipicephalus sanguineus]
MEAEEEFLEGEAYEDSLDPRIRARRYIVIDEIDDINEEIESQWVEVYEQLQSSLNKRLRQTLADCRRCPKEEAGASRKYFEQGNEEWRQLVTDIKADFHTACADFEKWRTEPGNIFQKVSVSRVQTAVAATPNYVCVIDLLTSDGDRQLSVDPDGNSENVCVSWIHRDGNRFLQKNRRPASYKDNR